MVIQEGEGTRVGGDTGIKINVRIIAATNKNLDDEVEANRFRLDLFYRINVIPIHIPALRERREDIIPLWQHFITIKAARLNKPVPQLTREIEGDIMTNAWHGNIRELENYIEKLISIGEVPETLNPSQTSSKKDEALYQIPKQLRTLDDIEKEAISEAIRELKGNISQVSKHLGLGRNTLYAKMKKHNISLKNK